MKSAIYLIKSAGRVKIGYSKNPWKRYRQLCTGCPSPMALILTLYCQDAPEFERYLHKAFEHKRENGEWFRVSINEVLKVIAERGLSTFSHDRPSFLEPKQDPDPQSGWRSIWDIETDGPMPESRKSATKEQMKIIESFYREATDEDLKGFFSSMDEFLKK